MTCHSAVLGEPLKGQGAATSRGKGATCTDCAHGLIRFRFQVQGRIGGGDRHKHTAGLSLGAESLSLTVKRRRPFGRLASVLCTSVSWNLPSHHCPVPGGERGGSERSRVAAEGVVPQCGRGRAGAERSQAEVVMHARLQASETLFDRTGDRCWRRRRGRAPASSPTPPAWAPRLCRLSPRGEMRPDFWPRRLQPGSWPTVQPASHGPGLRRRPEPGRARQEVAGPAVREHVPGASLEWPGWEGK